MTSAVPVICKGCGGAIVPPGPILTMIGFDGQFHVLCATSAAVLAEREACARIASGMSDGADCDERGAWDNETGEVPCGAESRGDVCVCAERSELAFKIADKIRARNNSTQ